MKTIDIHTHGIGGYDTQTSDPGDILHIAEIHGGDGISEIVPTVYPSGIETMRRNMLAIKKAMDLQGPAEGNDARIMGIHLEGPFLNSVKCGAMNSEAMLEANEYNFKKLIDGFEDIVKIITIAPELDGAAGLIKKISGAGIIVSMGHSDATYSEAEAGFRAGAKGITHLFNAMRGIHHREPGIAGFGLLNKEVYIEIIADPFHLSEKILELVFTQKDPDRIILVSDTVSDSGKGYCPAGVVNQQGRLKGGSMTVRESADRLVKMGIDKETVKRSLSENPSRYLAAT